MWKTVLQPFIANNFYYQQLRTTYVMKRKHVAPLASAHSFPSLRSRHQIYEVVEDNAHVPKMIPILLRKYVEDLGGAGSIVETKESKARFLILTNAAVYPTEENKQKFGKSLDMIEQDYSSRFAGTTARKLSLFVLNVSMNKENPWTIEPWHIRAAFRKAHVHVPEHCFTMPSTPISGPDMNLENKEFYITVTINNTDKAPVRCRVHHWATHEKDRLPLSRMHWKFPAETVFPEDVDTAKKLNLPEIIPPVLPPEEDLPETFTKRKKRLGT